MSNGFWLAVGQMCQLCFWTVRYLPSGGWRQLPRRSLMFGLAIPVLIVFQLLHWLGFALDELFFRRYRNTRVKAPIVVTGIPRSGTTHLQRVLAEHEQLTSMQTWECVFAPSISERYFYRALATVFSPLAWLTARLPNSFFKSMAPIHQLGLTEAEEDFICLLPINACFLLVILFPDVDHYWQLSRFDTADIPAKKKQKIMRFYQRMVQKHLFFHGEQKRYLCKNPSFMMWVKALDAQFSDVSFIICERPPQQVIASQLSSLQPSWSMIQNQPMSADFSQRITLMLASYYHYLEQLPSTQLSLMRLPMTDLVSDIEASVSKACQHAHIPLTPQFSRALAQQVEKAKQYRSAHQYAAQNKSQWQAWSVHFPKKYSPDVHTEATQ